MQEGRPFVALLYFVSKPDSNPFRLPEFEALAAFTAPSTPNAPRAVLLRSVDDLPVTSGNEEVASLLPEPARQAVASIYQGFVADRWPVVYAYLPSLDVARRIAERSITLRSIHLPLAVPVVAATTPLADDKTTTATVSPEELGERLSATTCAAVSGDRRSVFGAPPSVVRCALAVPAFRYEVESLERKYPQADKQALMVALRSIPHEGRVVLAHHESADVAVFRVFVVHTVDPKTRRNPVFAFAQHTMVVAESVRLDLVDRYSLKRRRYIGTTTMPPEWTFLMANFAGVSRNHLVLDPFVGTGGTLLTAAHWGASTIGFDMDGRVLRSGAISGKQAEQALKERTKARLAWLAKHNNIQGNNPEAAAGDTPDLVSNQPCLRSNFTDQHGLTAAPADAARLNFFVACRTCLGATARLRGPFLDAILTDPPYGIREPQRRVATVDGEAPETEAEVAEATATAQWTTGDLLLDLVGFAASALVTGGSLVYWHPTGRSTFTPTEIPRHPALKLQYALEQPLSMKVSRWLIVLRKHREPIDTMAELASMRESHAAPAQDVREAAFATTMGGDGQQQELKEAYDGYRARREASRRARLEWQAKKEAAAGATEEASEGDTAGGIRTRPTRQDRRESHVLNRQRKLEEREAKRRENEDRQRQRPQPPPTKDGSTQGP